MLSDLDEKIERYRTIHRMAGLAIDEAIAKGQGPIEALQWALQYGKRFNLTEQEVAQYLITPPDEFLQKCRREFEDADSDGGNLR